MKARVVHAKSLFSSSRDEWSRRNKIPKIFSGRLALRAVVCRGISCAMGLFSASKPKPPPAAAVASPPPAAAPAAQPPPAAPLPPPLPPRRVASPSPSPSPPPSPSVHGAQATAFSEGTQTHTPRRAATQPTTPPPVAAPPPTPATPPAGAEDEGDGGGGDDDAEAEAIIAARFLESMKLADAPPPEHARRPTLSEKRVGAAAAHRGASVSPSTPPGAPAPARAGFSQASMHLSPPASGGAVHMSPPVSGPVTPSSSAKLAGPSRFSEARAAASACRRISVWLALAPALALPHAPSFAPSLAPPLHLARFLVFCHTADAFVARRVVVRR